MMEQLKGIKVLLIDDEPTILQFLSLGLTNEGFDIKATQDGIEGINVAKEFKPHIAIVDVMLPFPNLLDEVSIGPFKIDDRRKEIKYLNHILDLSPTEYALLKFLVINHGLVLSKSTILDRVWGYDFGGEENIVEVYIRSLREKLQDHSRTVIRTLRGVGYRIDIS